MGGAGIQAAANTGGIALEVALELSPSLRCSVKPELFLMLRKHCVEGQKSPLSLGTGAKLPVKPSKWQNDLKYVLNKIISKGMIYFPRTSLNQKYMGHRRRLSILSPSLSEKEDSCGKGKNHTRMSPKSQLWDLSQTSNSLMPESCSAGNSSIVTFT